MNYKSKIIKKAQENDMFGGVSEETIREQVKSKDTFSKLMYSMSILSDAQEEMSRGEVERARQFINRAKFIISEEMQKFR